ncbi:hormogonium polysaccharide biosynthesis glycosyltransferase HpsE [Leptolyngbya sp. FACHB-261]|uniref:hormogonium polysaccharide biosynthesis glycosyltransferase HpsE n=1 Tax=Leptolyngbya sp. FACHB-261 TaxID=2692806 RepID=UPI0028C44E63|nr:hormogonium polysaccharide biosynthesis glycosyltransferase HpsE [Leptolyngbya sp. FACHB-261]
MVDFTVAIPTYNGESRLPEVLDRLRTQVGVEHLDWEVIVVDNNSTDRTATIVQDYQANWPQACPLRYYLETQQGAAFARQRAAEEAQGIFIGFLDDDNLPAPNWVAAAHAFGQDRPSVGAYGSQIHGAFEVEPPADFKRIAPFLAIIERGPNPRRYEPEKKMLPPGAGLVVRKQAWLKSVPKSLVLNNKGKEAGLASEDLEALLHVQNAGWEIWYNPTMEVYHKIPPWRLEREYLIVLLRCVGLSRHRIRMLSIQPWQRPLALPAYFANDLRKLIFYFIKHRKTLKSDAIAASEFELLLSSLISPFYLWSKLLKSRFSFERLPAPVESSVATTQSSQ